MATYCPIKGYREQMTPDALMERLGDHYLAVFDGRERYVMIGHEQKKPGPAHPTLKFRGQPVRGDSGFIPCAEYDEWLLGNAKQMQDKALRAFRTEKVGADEERFAEALKAWDERPTKLAAFDNCAFALSLEAARFKASACRDMPPLPLPGDFNLFLALQPVWLDGDSGFLESVLATKDLKKHYHEARAAVQGFFITPRGVWGLGYVQFRGRNMPMMHLAYRPGGRWRWNCKYLCMMLQVMFEHYDQPGECIVRPDDKLMHKAVQTAYLHGRAHDPSLPDPDEPARPSPKECRTATVESYMRACAAAAMMAREHGSEEMRHVYAQLQVAHLYEFDPIILHRMSKKILMSITGGSEEKVAETIHQKSILMPPLPEKRPARSMYLAFGPGIILNSEARRELVADNMSGTARNAQFSAGDFVFAYLVTMEGVWILTRSEEGGQMGMFRVCEADGTWLSNLSLAAWTVPWLIRLIEGENASVTQQRGKQYRSTWKRNDKTLRMNRPTPAPFYTVTVSHRFSDETVRNPGTPRSIQPEWKHCWPVDAHERMLVQRGMLPIKPGDKAALMARGYTVFEGAVDERCAASLARRHKPKQQPGEWIACRYVRVREHVAPANRDDLPLIRGVKRLKRMSIQD